MPSKTLLLKLFCLLLLPLAANGQQTQLVSRDQALFAYAEFAADPIAKLNQAPVFLKFIETDGEAHIVLDQKLTAWMYEDHEPEARAVLYAAYMGSNMNAQLTGASNGDDAVQGMTGVIEAYRKLKVKYPKLSIAMLESLLPHLENGTLEIAVTELQSN
ncbi:MAG: hypothetical protein ACU84Q_07080 [Gammaproteobacteria bacterium]